MSIQSLDDYLAAKRQILTYFQYAASNSFGALDAIGTYNAPGAWGPQPLDAPNGVNGVVPVAGAGGFPKIKAFASGATGYVTRLGVLMAGSQPGNMVLADRLYWIVSGTGPTDGTLTPTAPDYSGRLPGGDASGTELWIESTGGLSGSPAVITVTYTNAVGVSGRVSQLTPSRIDPGGMARMPLQDGDTGVQSIQAIAWTGLGFGNRFNVTVLRPLCSVQNGGNSSFGDVLDLLRSGLAQVYETSALTIYWENDAVTFGNTPQVLLEIASK